MKSPCAPARHCIVSGERHRWPAIDGAFRARQPDSPYCLASRAASTCWQAAGSDAIVIGWLGFGGSFDGFGWMMESLNQKARSAGLQPSLGGGSGWFLHSPMPEGHFVRVL